MSNPVTATDTETRSAQQLMLDQQLALSAYLGALLQPAAVEPVPETRDGPVVAAASEIAPVQSAEAAVIGDELTDIISESAGIPTQPEPAPVTAGHPDWAQGEFQCLLFHVAGLTLALPLARLSGVLPWDAAAVTPLPNHQPWFLGLREHLGHQVKLIDVAKVVLPPGRVGEESDLGKVILIDDSRWGLACSAVTEVITLSADAVKWRSRQGSRPWLAGTVIEHMCALIDTTAFASLLSGQTPEPT